MLLSNLDVTIKSTYLKYTHNNSILPNENANVLKLIFGDKLLEACGIIYGNLLLIIVIILNDRNDRKKYEKN